MHKDKPSPLSTEGDIIYDCSVSHQNINRLGVDWMNINAHAWAGETRAAWIHGSYSQGRLHIYALEVNPDAPNPGIEDALIDTIVDWFANIYGIQKSFITVDYGFIMNSDKNIVKSWETGELKALWVHEGILLDFYHLGGTEEYLYRMSGSLHTSPREAQRAAMGRMSGFVHDQFKGNVIVRNLAGHELSRIQEHDNNFYTTDYVDIDTPVQSYGLLLHIADSDSFFKRIDPLNKGFPEDWGIHKKRILHSLRASADSAGVKHGDLEKFLYKGEYESLFSIVDTTDSFPSQEAFSNRLRAFRNS